MPKNSKSRLELIQEFELAPMSALFTQKTIAAIRDCSEATIERDRWAGTGIAFLKISGRSCRYRKETVLEWLKKHRNLQSTSEA